MLRRISGSGGDATRILGQVGLALSWEKGQQGPQLLGLRAPRGHGPARPDPPTSVLGPQLGDPTLGKPGDRELWPLQGDPFCCSRTSPDGGQKLAQGHRRNEVGWRGTGCPWWRGRWVPRRGGEGAPGDGAAGVGVGWAQTPQRRQPRPWLESEHSEGRGVQFGGEAGALGAGGARRPGEPVKNVLAF